MSSKDQSWTRKKLYRKRRAAELEEKQREKEARKHAASTLRKESKVESAFRGIDPERTERLARGD